jgi:transcriptional regulator with XRE-family HTH domain
MLRRFGDKLRYLRRQRQITQVDLAYRLGTAAQGHLSLLEHGRRQPSIELVLRIADLFTVSTDYLLRDSIPINQPLAAPIPSPAREALPRLFSAKLRYLRTQRHLTQVDVSNLLLLRTQAHISLLESGRSEPSLELLLQLSDLFGVTTDYLLRDAIPVEPPMISGSDHLMPQS